MVEPTCPSPAPLGLTETVRSASAQAGTASAAGEDVVDEDAPAVDGEAGLEAPIGVPAAPVVLLAAGAVGELPHAVNVTQAVSRMPPITAAVERAIAGPTFIDRCRRLSTLYMTQGDAALVVVCAVLGVIIVTDEA